MEASLTLAQLRIYLSIFAPESLFSFGPECDCVNMCRMLEKDKALRAERAERADIEAALLTLQSANT